MSNSHYILYYIHDPMCSWCYAFKPVLQQLRNTLPKNIQWISLLGGLAEDSEQPMADEMRNQLQSTWQRIEKKLPNTLFNYDFWHHWQETQPRRASYASCRAVIAARTFNKNTADQYDEKMIHIIQKAYYQESLNPANDDVLIKLSERIGLDPKSFKQQFYAQETQQSFTQELNQCQTMNIHSYPSLVLKVNQSYWPISIDYQQQNSILESIESILAFEPFK